MAIGIGATFCLVGAAIAALLLRTVRPPAVARVDDHAVSGEADQADLLAA